MKRQKLEESLQPTFIEIIKTAIGSFKRSLTASLEQTVLDWSPEVCEKQPYPYVVEQVTTRAQQRAAATIEHNRKRLSEFVAGDKELTKLVREALKSAGIDASDVTPRDIAPIMDEIRKNASSASTLENRYGLLCLIGRGSWGEKKRGKVPARTEVVISRILGKTSLRFAELAKSRVHKKIA